MKLRLDVEKYTAIISSLLGTVGCLLWVYIIEYWLYGNGNGIVLYLMPARCFVAVGCAPLDFPGSRCIHIMMTSHECHGVSHHWQLHLFSNNLFRLTAKKTSKLQIIQSWHLVRAIHSEHFHVMLSSWNPLECWVVCSTKILKLKSFHSMIVMIHLCNTFAHVTTARLSWLVQICDLMP